ncbi:hypothetical protein FACS1894182_07650 [Bacteroidia bacterium]|nr:hypothetical protein FACS1894182_07650 [Bacteroidia bacterium]
MKTKKIFFLTLFLALAGHLFAQDLSGIKIYVNPGHGGWDSDDRGIATPLFPYVGPNVGFWESQSNLDKGLQLRDMLEGLGATVVMSRTQNRTEDDLNLAVIVRAANECHADYMLSIHSNAGNGVANYVLMLYAGVNADDPQQKYPTATPVSAQSRAVSTVVAGNLFSNKMNYWTSNPRIDGDKTFARLIMGWSDGYGVLRGLNVPGEISEGSMHDYIPETYRLMNMEYKWLEAWHFLKSFVTYYERGEIPTGNIAGWVKDGRNVVQEKFNMYAKDKLLSINGAKVTIVETGETYTVDDRNNGVYLFKNQQPGVYTLKVEAEGYYTQEQPITVEKNNVSYFNFELNMVRNTPPAVIKHTPDVSPTDSVECSSDIVLEFNWDMDEESTRNAFSISPAVEGTLAFEDSQHRLRFKSTDPLEKSTIYTVKLDKSAKHPDNLSMVEDFVFSFKTKSRNRLAYLAGYPQEGDQGVYTSPSFWYVFGTKLATANLRESINVYDKNGNQIDKATRSVKNNNVPAPYGAFYFELGAPLVAGENYKVIIDGAIKDDVGVQLTEPIEINFTVTDVKVTGQPLLDDFEATGLYSYNAGQSSLITSASVARNTTTKLFGNASYKFSYAFDVPNDGEYAGPYNFSATYPAATPVTVTKDKAIGVHIYGDMSGNELQLLFKSGETIDVIKLCDLDFIGWEYVKTDLSELSKPESEFIGFRIHRQLIGSIKEQLTPLGSSGDIYLDNALLYNNGLNSIFTPSSAGKVTIYPNPASNIVYVTGIFEKTPLLQLYSLNGVLLKETVATEMNVEEYAPGTYILKIKTDRFVESKTLIIVK